MASIREIRKDGKVISYRFTVCLERDAEGKQVRQYTTWTPPAGLTYLEERNRRNRSCTMGGHHPGEHEKEKATDPMLKASLPLPEMRHDSFFSFVKDIWLPLQVRNGNCNIGCLDCGKKTIPAA